MDRAHPASLLISVVLLATTSCGSAASEPLATVGDVAIEDSRFAAYLQLRSLRPRGDVETSEVLDEYLRRHALSAAIERTDVLDANLLAAEIEEQAIETRVSRYFDQYLRTAVTDAAVAAYYAEHAAEYEDREVHVAHVLVRTQHSMSDEERQAALTRAREAYASIRSGRDFADVARDISEDAASAARGGDLGWIREGAIDPRFSERAFGAEVGVTMEPFETAFGYHVLRVLEAPATRRRALAAVEGDIRYLLRAQARDAELERLLSTVTITRREGGYRATERSADPAGEHRADRASAEAEELAHAGD